MSQPERSNLIPADPADLLKDNPAAYIINHESYERIAANFSYGPNGEGEYDIPQVVRVATYSASGEETIKLFVRDGHTRTMYVYDHLNDVILPKYPEFIFKVRDVTDSQLNNPITVPPDERKEGQTALTMLQYLRSVVPPTVEHSLIAPDRIAAHLMGGWDNMVGHTISERFSAIAALSFLQDPRVPIATERLLRQSLSKPEILFTDETPEEREQVEKALIGMSSVIIQSRVMRDRIAESAFALVATGSNKIGGERAAIRQIYGLLRTPVVEDRLKDFPPGDKEKERSRLGQLITDAFKKIAQDPEKERLVSVFVQAIRDPRLSLVQIKQILTSETPEAEYDGLRKKINEDKLRESFFSNRQNFELSEDEATLLRNLGSKAFLEDRELTSMCSAIDSATKALSKTSSYRNNIVDNQEHLKRSGVKNITIADALVAIDSARSALLLATTTQTVTERTRRLTDTLNEEEGKISREITKYRAEQIIDEIFGEELTGGSGILPKGRIINYVASQFGKIDTSNESFVRQKVSQLLELPPELQTRVILFEGGLRLEAAIRIHQGTDTYSIDTSYIDTPPLTPPTISLPETPHEPPVITDDEDRIDIQQREVERIRVNNIELDRLVQSFRSGFRELDLEKGEVETRIASNFEAMMRENGLFWFEHPDLIRMSEEYSRLLQERRRAIEDKLQREEDETSRDKRTSI